MCRPMRWHKIVPWKRVPAVMEEIAPFHLEADQCFLSQALAHPEVFFFIFFFWLTLKYGQMRGIFRRRTSATWIERFKSESSILSMIHRIILPLWIRRSFYRCSVWCVKNQPFHWWGKNVKRLTNRWGIEPGYGSWPFVLEIVHLLEVGQKDHPCKHEINWLFLERMFGNLARDVRWV